MKYLFQYTDKKVLLYKFEYDKWILSKEYALGELVQLFVSMDLTEYNQRFQQFNNLQDNLLEIFNIKKHTDITNKNFADINQFIKDTLLIPCGTYSGETFFPPTNNECLVNYLPYYLTKGLDHPYLQYDTKNYFYGLYNNCGIFDYKIENHTFYRNLSLLDNDAKNELSPIQQYYNNNGGQIYQSFEEKVIIMKSGEIIRGYTFNTAGEALTYEFYKMMETSVKTRKCQLCSNYFIVKNERAHFCSAKCQKISSDMKQRKKINSHPISKEYDTAVKRMCARKRNNKITTVEYNNWSYNANKIYLEYKNKYDIAETDSMKQQILLNLKKLLFEPLI